MFRSILAISGPRKSGIFTRHTGPFQAESTASGPKGLETGGFQGKLEDYRGQSPFLAAW
jgi:hypothetical protein